MRLPRKPTLINREILRFAHDYRSLDDILQFANVTGPGVRLKQFQALFVYPANALSRFSRIAIDEVLNEHWNVFLAFSQRRHLNRENVEPVKEVTPKCVFRDRRLQITVRGSNHANISSDRSSSTDTFEFMFLQNTQESDLRLGRKLSDFIEEDGASFGQLKAPQAPLSCPGEGPLLMAEQFRRDQVAWNCGAVNTGQRSRGTLRAFVDGTCDQFFARPRFAGDQNGGVCRSNLGDTREYRVQRGRNPHDLLEHRCPIYFFAQRNVFVAESLLSLLAVLNIGRSHIPTNDASLLISHGVIA